MNLSAGFILAQELARHWFEHELKHGGAAETDAPPAYLAAGWRKKIIFVASVLTFTGSVNVPAYVASKGAVGQLTKALNNEWMARGICVNSLAPGYIETELTSGIRADEDKERIVLDRVPLGRWGTVGDLEGAAVWLAGRGSNFVGGEICVVDGGFVGR